MANYVHDHALCLRTTDFSETSQIVGLLTREHGLVPMIAKGSKRPPPANPRKAGGGGGGGASGTGGGGIDLLTTGEVVFIPAKGAAELGTLTAWELLDHRPLLRKNLAALHAAMICADISLMLLHPADPHPGLFEEFSASMDLFITEHRTRAVVAYAKALLGSTGYTPHLEACVVCGKLFSGDQEVRFSPAGGGAVCRECRPEGVVLPVPRKILIALERLPSPGTLQTSLPEKPGDVEALRTAMHLLLAQVEHIAGRQVKTRSLMSTVFTAPAA